MSPTPPDAAPSLELSLREVLRRVMRRRVSLVVLPLLAGAVAAAASMLLGNVYRAQAIISIEQPRRRPGDPLVPLDTLVQNYRALAGSPNLQQPAMTSLAASDGLVFTPDEFHSRVGVSVPRESQMLYLSFTHQDPAIAERVANRLAEHLTASVNAFNRAEVDRFLARYHSDIGTARQDVEDTSERYTEFIRDSQIDLLHERVTVAADRRSELENRLQESELQRSLLASDPIPQSLADAEEAHRALEADTQIEALTSQRMSLLEQRGDFEERLATVRVDLAGARERLAALEGDLGEEPQILPLRRTIDAEPALQQAAAAATGHELGDLLGLTLTSETLNPVHADVATEVVTTRAQVAEFDRTETALSDRLESLETEIREINDAIYRGQTGLDRTQRAVELADAEYRALYETSPQGLAVRSAQLSAEIASLTGDLETMRTEEARGNAAQRRLQQDWDLAHERMAHYSTELATATLNILEQMPSLAVFAPAVRPTEPESKHRLQLLAAGLLLGFGIALFRAYLLEF